MGTKNDPGVFDCYAAAEPDEPLFVLLARDPDAPALVEAWAEKRVPRAMRLEGDERERAIDKVNEARRCAVAMRAWRDRNRA